MAGYRYRHLLFSTYLPMVVGIRSRLREYFTRRHQRSVLHPVQKAKDEYHVIFKS